MVKKIHPNLDTTKVLDSIEAAVYALVKPYGFRKHGRTLHRFVSGDISQIIHFQLGQAYREETHLLVVNVGIRIPECVNRQFAPEINLRKYYPEYSCNLRSRLGEIEGKDASRYDLRQPVPPIIDDILRQIETLVIPTFEVLNSREAILAKRRNYPRFDLMNRHLILLEEAMIYGRQGNPEKAKTTFCKYYHLIKTGSLAQKTPKQFKTICGIWTNSPRSLESISQNKKRPWQRNPRLAAAFSFEETGCMCAKNWNPGSLKEALLPSGREARFLSACLNFNF